MRNRTTKTVENASICKFCGQEVIYNNIRRRVLDPDGVEHVARCEIRAIHYHELAMDAAEEKRQQMHAEYNRAGTEDEEGEFLSEAMELQEFCEGLELYTEEELRDKPWTRDNFF